MFDQLRFSGGSKENAWAIDRPTQTFFQPKLFANQPGDTDSDRNEQEADTVANRITNPGMNASNSFFNASVVQRKTSDISIGNTVEAISGGRSLNLSERSFFESAMGYDFSNVRIHDNSEANESAKNINALAYTHGNDIVFGSGQYQPNTTEGKRLLAHELAHVVQQKNAGTVRRKTYLQEENISDTRTVDSESRIKEVILKTFANTGSKLYPYIKDRIEKFKDKAVISKDDADVYGHKYNKINKDSKWQDKEVKEHVQGFVDRKHQYNIYLYDRSKYCHAFHEAVHAISNLPILLQFFGGFLNEGLTQYFTDIIFTEQIGQQCTTHNYKDQLGYAANLVTFIGEDRMAKIFFTDGFSGELNNVATAFGLKDTNGLSDFKDKRGMEKFLKEKYKIKAGFNAED